MRAFRPTVLSSALLAGVLLSQGAAAHTYASEQPPSSSAPTSSQPPLDSRSRFEAWLRANPDKAAPFDAFTAGGRERFLGGLTFTERGIFSVAPEDLVWELDQQQAKAVFDLIGLGDDPIATRLRTEPAPLDWRGDKEHPSEIDQRYTKYNALVDQTRREDFLRRARHIGEIYRKQFPETLIARADELSKPDLLILARASANAATGSSSEASTQDLFTLIPQLEQRGLESRELIQDAQRALLTSGRMDDARALAAKHPSIELEAIPAVTTPVSQLADGPGWWRLSDDEASMTAESPDLSQTQILVLAGCHFSVDAAQDIEADPDLGPVFAAHAHWLGQPPGIESIGVWKEWNTKFPNTPMHLITKQSDWDMFPDWDMPTYAIVKDGKVVDQTGGSFRAAPENRVALVKMLRRHGLMTTGDKQATQEP
ncbi:hypothetical protein [Pseudoxanthomonas sp. JBR18]|uniref:hypothetical protein n=1 Tax=Pseudoxanthomonas sp. JBR18 TaxID=2969308 RepID=UPI002306B3C5|nr:hypothetical protein [Pseudoxanthomonas sp. JBR18]WCE03451.1 hypothetical protein PJ250_15315 [Pseudoxanthomonas sp. JBR18]